MINIRRRAFIFGVSAAIIVPSKTIHLMPGLGTSDEEIWKQWMEEQIEVMRQRHAQWMDAIRLPIYPSADELSAWVGDLPCPAVA